MLLVLKVLRLRPQLRPEIAAADRGTVKSYILVDFEIYCTYRRKFLKRGAKEGFTL